MERSPVGSIIGPHSGRTWDQKGREPSMLLRTSHSGRVLLAALVALVAVSSPALCETRAGGKLPAGVTTWNKLGSPYIVTEDVVVPAGATLKIEPGTTVRFKSDISDGKGKNVFDLEILVEGTLSARGAAGDTVIFTSDAQASRWTDWQGIIVQGEAARLELLAVTIEYANEGIKVFNGAVTAKDATVRLCQQTGIAFIGGRGTLENVLVTFVGNTGGTGVGVNADRGAQVDMKRSFVVGTQNGIMFSRGSGGTVEECTVSLCLGRGIVARNSDPTITGTTVTGNDWGVVLSAGARAKVHGNNIFQNGNSDLSLSGYGPETVKLDVSGNWWGQSNVAAIQEHILDGLDDPAEKGIAVIEPILEEAVTRPAVRK